MAVQSTKQEEIKIKKDLKSMKNALEKFIDQRYYHHFKIDLLLSDNIQKNPIEKEINKIHNGIYFISILDFIEYTFKQSEESNFAEINDYAFIHLNKELPDKF